MLQDRVRSLFASLRQRGLIRTSTIGVSYLLDCLFDLQHGTDTSSWVDLDDLGMDDGTRQRAVMYQPTQAIPLRRLLRKLKIAPGKVIVDFGCGKGRVLLVASEFAFKEARGIEVSPLLCEIALKNCSRYREKAKTDTRFTIVQSNVLDYELNDDEDVLFLFNPFDAYILNQVLHKITASLQRRNRDILIIYRYALHAHVIDENRIFAKTLNFRSWEQDFVVYSNSHCPAFEVKQTTGVAGE